MGWLICSTEIANLELSGLPSVSMEKVPASDMGCIVRRLPVLCDLGLLTQHLGS